MPSSRQRKQRTYASECVRTARAVDRARIRHRQAAIALRDTERALTVGNMAVRSEDLDYCRKVERRLSSLLSKRVQDADLARRRFEAVNAR